VNTVMESLWGESTRKRIWKDTKEWLKNHIIVLFLVFIVTGGGSVVATLFIPATMNFRLATLWGFIGGLVGLAILVGCICGIQSILVFKKQRDEVRKLYGPMKELANIKSGDTIKEKEINVSLMFEELKSNHLANVTFEHCVLRGPCIIMLEGNCEFHKCNLASGVGATLFERKIGTKYYGVGVFVHCKFNLCNFDNLSFLLYEKQRDKFLSEVVKI